MKGMKDLERKGSMQNSDTTPPFVSIDCGK